MCFESARTADAADRYRYAVERLHIPASAVDPAGALALYRVRVETSDGEVLRAFTCRIPHTPEAIRVLDRRFDVENRRRALRASWWADPCPSGVCALPPLVVTVSTGYGSGGGGSSGGTPGLGMCEYSASAGDCWDDGTGEWWDGGADGTYRPECQRDANGNCITRTLTGAEWSRLYAQIDSIKESSALCSHAKQLLQQVALEGRFRFWDGTDIRNGTQRLGENLPDGMPAPDGTAGNGRVIELDSYWAYAEPWVVVHEGIHYWYNLLALQGTPVNPYPSEDDITAQAKLCVTRFS